MKRVRFGIIGALLAVAWAVPLQAQEATGTVRGRIVDDAQQPLQRATVAVGGRGTFTNADGRFAIAGVPAGQVTIRVRMLGYAPASREVTVVAGYPVVVDFTMTAQAINLAEIVVTGYGEQTAGDITGAVTHLGSEDFNPGRITAPAQLLQSKVAGVQVVDNNEPGGGTTIRIRGATSWTASSDPLYVVDGMPLGTGSGGGLSSGRDPLNFLNPNDIQSIVVLKDASAAAIYGANAANGVVLITTKSGGSRQGQQVEYTSSASTSSVTRLPRVLNADQFRAIVQAQAPGKVASLGSANTNWLDLVSRTAYGQEQNVSLTNAAERTFYRLSFGYLNQNGIIRGTQTERLSLGLNYDQHFLGDHLDIKANLKGSRANDQFSGGAIGQATAMAPTQPVNNPADPTGFWDWRNTNAGTFNPMAELAMVTNQGTTWRSVGNVQADYRFPFLDALRANINLGYDVAKAGNSTFYPSILASQTLQGHGNLYLSNNTQATSLFEGYLNYSAPLGFVPGNVDITGGYSYNQSHGNYMSFSQGSLNSNFLGIYGNPGGTVQPSNPVSAVDYKLISFFGRANYNLNDRYLASFSVRRDGSSRFGPGNQWGTFPAVSGAWRLSQESFLQGVRSVSDLKLRASWAETGNQAFGDYLAYPTYTYGDGAVQYFLGGQFVTTIRPSAVDKNIHWESTRSWDIGLDYGFLNQRFSGAIDWYTKKTTDMLFYVPIAAGATFSNYVTTNVGTMQNQGWEANLTARLLEGRGGDLTWTADFTVSHNSNKLISINPSQSVTSINVGNISGGVGNTIQVLLPGQPISSFYMYQHKNGANGQPVWATGAGADTLMYVDQNHDGTINNLDKRPYHSPFPTLELGHTSSFTYHSFDFGFTLRAQLGNYVYNNVAAANGSYQNVTGSANPSNMDASILKTGFGTVQYFSDYYVESASFLRMDNITLGYSFPVSGRVWRVYATVQNVFTVTGYTGVDPTAGLNGIDNNIYPRSRTVTGGLSVRF